MFMKLLNGVTGNSFLEAELVMAHCEVHPRNPGMTPHLFQRVVLRAHYGSIGPCAVYLSEQYTRCGLMLHIKSI